MVDKIDYGEALGEGVPEHTVDGLRRYFDGGLPPGGFLRAVFANDMDAALSCADSLNAAAIGPLLRWLQLHAPVVAWGSVEAVEGWLERHAQLRDSA